MSLPILLANKSQTIHKIISYTLLNEPFELDIANSWEVAREKLEEKFYPIVLLDFELSEAENGYELAKQINANGKNSSIIMLFNSFHTIDEKKLLEAGVKETLKKPFDSQQLLEICRSSLQNLPPPSDGSRTKKVQNEKKLQKSDPILPPEKKTGDTPYYFQEHVPEIIGQEKNSIAANSPLANDLLTDNIPPVINNTELRQDQHLKSKSLDGTLDDTLEDVSDDTSELITEGTDEETVVLEIDKNKVSRPSLGNPAEWSPELKSLIEKKVEKIAWEIIPELAEKIIKKEIKDLKKLVIKQ